MRVDTDMVVVIVLPEEIPTLDQYMLMMLMLILATLGGVAARRVRR